MADDRYLGKLFFVVGLFLLLLVVTMRAGADSKIDLGASDYISGNDMNAGNMIGREVIDKNRKKIGHVKDLLLDKNNKIAYAVVFVGGVHEVNLNKHVAVPFDEQRIKADQAEKSLVLNLALQELGQKPEFKPEKTDAAGFEYAISAESLIGMDVFGKNGALLGEVNDLIFNNNYDVKYAIVVTSGIVNISDKLVAVPYHELKINKDKDKENVTLDVTSQELEDAPGFQYRRPRP